MATPIQSEADPSNQDEIPSSSAADGDLESPLSLETSEIAIDKSRQGGDDSELQDKRTGDLLMLPLEIEREEVELPLLTKGGEESELPRDFGSGIPDSEAVSDWSSIIDGGKHECGEIDCGNRSNTSPVQAAPSQLGLSNAIAPKALGMETEGEEMEQISPYSQLVEPSVTTDIVRKQADVSSQVKTNSPKAEAQLLDNSPIEDTKSNNEANRMPETSKIGFGGDQCTETGLHMPVKVNSPPGSLCSEIVDSQTIRISSDEQCASHDNGPGNSDIQLAEKPEVEVDMPALTAEADSVSLINDPTRINESKTATPSLPNPIESRMNISPLEADDASPISLEKQDKSVASTVSSSPRVKTQEGNSTQTKQTHPPITPFKGPVPSPNNDIMATELKAMKIVGEAFFFPSFYSDFKLIRNGANTFFIILHFSQSHRY